jgi:UDP-glucose 4-epimerase
VRALVTGGGGFIGSNVASRLLREGHKVVVLDNFSTGYRVNVESLEGTETIDGDVRDGELVARLLRGADVVFHLAASVGNSRSIADPVDDAEVNLVGTLRLLEGMRRSDTCHKIVYSSSAGIFGQLKHLPIAEDHPLDPDSPYGVSKLGGEKVCLAYTRLYDLQAVCLRYFNVYGVNQRYDAYGNVIPIFVHQLLSGQTLTIFSDGEQTRDFVNVADVAEANLRAAAADASGAFNIASGKSITISGLVDLLAEVSGLTPKLEYGPPRKGDVRDSLADVSAARDTLGWAPNVGLREGLREYVEWSRAELASAVSSGPG